MTSPRPQLPTALLPKSAAPKVDREISRSYALVIDANPTSRSLLASQLRDFGLGTVMQSSRIHEARKMLESRTFDVVLCEHEFAGAGYSGQNLLDDLRRNNMLPLSTVFIIVTSEASYSTVADAAESALDSYLLKPHTAASLAQRLAQARHRKRTLADIFKAIEDQDFETATALCLQRFQARNMYWLYAARIGSELLLRQKRYEEGKRLYEAVLETGALPWARLGIARAQIDANQPSQALRTLESLIGEQPTYVDAYDVMGRLQVEQGDLSKALDTYRRASELTPGSISRLQKHGMLAFYMGDMDESSKMLERATSLGISSKMFDFQSLVLLAFSRFHQRDTKGLQRCIDNLNHALEKAPQSKRLQRFVTVVNVFSLMLHKQVAAAVSEVRAIAETLRDPGLDVEAACNILSMLAQLTGGELKLDGAEEWVDTLALRFASSKGLTELLACTANAHPPFAQRVNEAHVRINGLAEQAVGHSLQGNHRVGVQTLIHHGELTLNSKLIDMARMTLQRHRTKISDADELQAVVDDLRSRYSNGVGMPSLGQGARQAGGLTLREGGKKTDEAGAAADAAAPPPGDQPPEAQAA